MSHLLLSINDLTLDEKSQIFDLLILADMIPRSDHDPINNTHSIDIAINENDGRNLDGAMTYIMKHIINN
ncbi:MAG: hypothetical protein HOA38_00230 [Candidatus Marinimicrobia bacterium]|jgi:hypothetical protein|nr:hypothetical protein [Candidatus Neomarinimicrobiota bacterium]